MNMLKQRLGIWDHREVALERYDGETIHGTSSSDWMVPEHGIEEDPNNFLKEIEALFAEGR